MGFDGIVDEVYEVVKERYDKDNYLVMEHMLDFGQFISNAGTGGISKERVKKRTVCGGFTGNSSRAASALLDGTTMIGMYGAPVIDENFQVLAKNCRQISLLNPARCLVMEFSDGKLMMTDTQNMRQFTWNELVEKVTLPGLDEVFLPADIVCMGYWNNMPDFDNIFLNLSARYPEKPFFFDFGNISKRSEAALKNTLSLLSGTGNYKTISMNEHEGGLLFKYYGIHFEDSADGLKAAVEAARKAICIDALIVHDPRYAVISTATETVLGKQIYVEKPVKTAGAGDTFNMGYVFASLGDFSLAERIDIANANSRFYLKNGFPPGRKELDGELSGGI